MRLKKVTPVSDGSAFDFIEKLYIESFPPEERRPVTEFRRLAENEKAFTVSLLKDGDVGVGFFTSWLFNDFIYAEHFAVSSVFRNKGYGKQVLHAFFKETSLPIVLEVELPETELAKRRIGFYERAGFKLWDIPYMQPPYEEKYEPIPMKLMSYRTISSDQALIGMKKEIYRKVYKVNNSDLV